MDVAALIRAARHEAAMSQRALAERAGISQHTLSRYETGVRLPSIETLRTVLAATGKQLRTELEPLDADIVEAIEQVRAQPLDDRPGVVVWRMVSGPPDVAHRVEGLAAAAVLGAPVPVERLELSLADEPATFEWLAAQMQGWATRIRAPAWSQARVVQLDAHSLRKVIGSECPDGQFELTYAMTASSVILRPPAEVAHHVRVATVSGEIPVQALHEIDTNDRNAARVLAVLRGEEPGPDAAPPTTALRSFVADRVPRYDPVGDLFG
jgi:transcriptional regulator with XRE-family HTH domain